MNDKINETIKKRKDEIGFRTDRTRGELRLAAIDAGRRWKITPAKHGPNDPAANACSPAVELI